MVGERFANYLIQQKLGQGGMGVVYKAIDLSLDRPVAVKVLAPELARDPALVERFRHEAKALANLNHTNIATVYTLLETGGQYLMIMEYLEGDAFEVLIHRQGRIDCDHAIRWFKQALLGIGFAHRHGVIHRDIKPANIMLTPAGIVKVMDFGIAKVLGARRLTSSGTQMGTTAYMSPEQIRKEPVDARSDIYSLSVTLFEMLTGRLPFSSANDFDMMSAHLRTPPPPLNRFCPEIAKSVESAVARGLEKDPAARFQSAEQFGAALERLESSAKPLPQPLAPPPSHASPRAFPPRAPTPPRPALTPHKSRNPASALLCLTLGVAALFYLFYEGLIHESVGLLIACAVLLYFLPILIAAMLQKRNGAAVVKLNALHGWTGIGWIEAMKQALADDPKGGPT